MALLTPLPSSSQGTGGRKAPRAECGHQGAAGNSHEEEGGSSKIQGEGLLHWRPTLRLLPPTPDPLVGPPRIKALCDDTEGRDGGRKAQEGGDTCTLIHWGFTGGSNGKEPACTAGHLGSIPGLGRCPGGGHGNSLQCSCLENPVDRGAWRATVRGVAESEVIQGLSARQLTCVVLQHKPTQHCKAITLRLKMTIKKGPRTLTGFHLPFIFGL